MYLSYNRLLNHHFNTHREIPTILMSLAAQSLRTLHSPRLLITIHKSDSLPLKPSQTLARIRQSLTNEMDRLKSARSTIGGKIESISSVSSGKQAGIVANILRLFGIGGREKGEIVDEVAEEDAEGMIWGDKGSFKWEDVDGVDIEWAVSSISADNKRKAEDETEAEVVEDGLEEIRSWFEGL
jgi:signal recognition particle receptor subunit beta